MNEQAIKVIIIACGIIVPVSVYLASRLIKQFEKQQEQTRKDVKELYGRTEKNCRRIDIVETNIKNFRDMINKEK